MLTPNIGQYKSWSIRYRGKYGFSSRHKYGFTQLRVCSNTFMGMRGKAHITRVTCVVLTAVASHRPATHALPRPCIERHTAAGNHQQILGLHLALSGLICLVVAYIIV